MEEVEVEVRGRSGAFYKAFLKDVDGNQLIVTSESRGEQHVNVGDVRFPPPADTPKDYKEGDEVEAFTESSDLELQGWRLARIKMTKGEFLAVDYLGIDQSDSGENETVPVERVRPKNCNPCLNKVHQYSFEIPPDLTEISKDLSCHKDFMKASNASVIAFDDARNTLVVTAFEEPAIKEVALLSDQHLQSLRQKMQIKQQAELVAKSDESPQQNTKATFQEEFHVPEALMGLAVDTYGSYVSQARQLEGIISIDLEEECSTFRIIGMTEESVKSALKLLECAEVDGSVPPILVSHETIRLEILHQSEIPFFVYKLTSLQDEILALCTAEGEDYFIFAFDYNNMKDAKDVIPLTGIAPMDIAASSASNCVYVLQQQSNCFSVLRISKDEDSKFVISPWMSDLRVSISGIFVTSNGSILLPSVKSDKEAAAISKFDALGSCLYKLIIPADQVVLSYGDVVLEKANGNLIMVSVNVQCQTYLTEVDVSGRLIRQYCSSLGLESCVNFADVHGRILIIEPTSNRIELLDSEMNHLAFDHPQNMPKIDFLHFDSAKNELIAVNAAKFNGTILTKFRV